MKLIYLIEIATPRREHGSPVTPSVCHTLGHREYLCFCTNQHMFAQTSSGYKYSCFEVTKKFKQLLIE
jgi:hypothetical protein